MSESQRVYVIDDSDMGAPLVQRIAHEPGLRICGRTSHLGTALAAFDGELPDVVVLLVSTGSDRVIELITRIRLLYHGLPILVVEDEAAHIERVLRAGAAGYLTRQDGTHQIVRALRQLADGDIRVSDRLSAGVLERLLSATKHPPDRPASSRTDDAPVSLLCEFEYQLFLLVGKGRSIGEIAEELHLSPGTVEDYLGDIRTKLNLSDQQELFEQAVRWTVNRDARK